MRILMTSIVDLKKSQHNRPHQFAKYLAKKHDVTVISVNDWWKGNQYNYEKNNLNFDVFLDKIDYVYLTDKKIKPYLQEILFRNKIMKLSKHDFDVHLNYNCLVAGYDISKHINTVFDIADDLISMIASSPQIPFIMRPFGSFLGNHYLQNNIKNAKKISITTNSLIAHYNLPLNKVEIIPNGVDMQLFKEQHNMKKKLGLTGFIIGYVGVLREWVDLDPVFKALTQLSNDIHLVIVGKEGFFEKTSQLISNYNLAERVHMIGAVPYNEVPKYISAMDVCLIPFKNNLISKHALPLKLFEYMACKKPIISTPIPSLFHLGAQIFYANTVSDYIKNISSLYADPAFGEKIGESNYTLVKKYYDWDIILRKLEYVLSSTA